MTAPQPAWDIFCRVVDNWGDIGVCWRLAADLAGRGVRVRLWADDAAALAWMAPQGCPGVEVRRWAQPLSLDGVDLPAVLVETFGCDIPPELLAHCKALAENEDSGASRLPVWINLEHLSAEPYVERMHGLPSPVFQGPAAGWVRWFFYPGFTPATGGLLREPGLQARKVAFDRAAWLRSQGLPWRGERVVALFCYEPPALGRLLAQLAAGPAPTLLLVAPGRAAAAVQAVLAEHTNNLIANTQVYHCISDIKHPEIHYSPGNQLSINYLPYLTHADFDHLLWAADLNFVRGEDSVVRALWAGRPFVWHIYPQDDGAHVDKLEAFLDMLQAPADLRAFHRVWNGEADAALPPLDPHGSWQATAGDARARLLRQDDLATQLLGFVAQKQ